MEFVGRTVKKEFRGYGTFSGTVTSYDASSKFFKVVYEDGDSEELELSELVPLFHQTPKKRRRREMARARSGNTRSDSKSDFHSKSAASDESLAKVGGNVGFEWSLGECINLNVPVEDSMPVNLRDAVACNGYARVGFDLNSGSDLNEGLSLNDGCNLSPKDGAISGKSCGIDLNLDATSDMDENSRQVDVSDRKECLFDLNMGIINEMEDAELDAAGHFGQSALLPPVDANSEEVAIDVEVKFVDDYTADRTLKEVKADADDLTRVQKIGSSADIVSEDSTLVPVEVLSGNIMDNGPSIVLDGIGDHSYCLSCIDVACRPGNAPNIVDQSDLGNSYRQGGDQRRKRKMMDSTPGTVLRRSVRRGASKNQELEIVKSMAFSQRVSSPAVSAITEEKQEDNCDMPPKLDLPPPSKTLDLDGISIIDVFSVYSCLRSFSTLLFLSPFDLGDFVSALRSESSNTLFDCIHASLLQILRKHLEHLSSEGSASALHCLRSLNWNLLDSITWPVFLAEYLLLHGSSMELSELSSLKLFTKDYCKQPTSVKLNILRHLCDEVIEAEVIRSEINARSLGAEPDIDFDRCASVKTSRKRRAVVGNSGRDYFSEELTDDTADWNSDECCLCKMDGNLICCDGCPSAYHSRCVGLVSDLLPEGDWFCPECVIEINKSHMKQRRPLRGAELLGFDPHNRLYFSCCDYLLVSDSCETDVSYKFFHKKDLTSVIEVLRSSEHYSDLLKAIYKQWDVSPCLGGSTSDVDSVKCIAQKKILSQRNHPATSVAPVAVPNPVAFSGICETEDEKTLEKGSVIEESSGLNAGKFGKDPANGMDALYLSSEGSAEITLSSGSQGKDGYMAPTLSAVKPDNIATATPADTSLTLNTMKENKPSEQHGSDYMNCYSFGKIAAPVVEELLEKVKQNKDLLLSDEEIISQQMRAISKNVDRFYWPNDKSVGAQKEKCGWCFSCRTSANETDCLFDTYTGPAYEGSGIDMALLQSSRNKSSHFIGVVGGILSIKVRLRGLLLGPWLNSQYAEKWRKSAFEASDIAPLKSLLLKLASNLHHLAISEEWTEYEDSALVLGSASHVVTSSTLTSSKRGPGRKRGKLSDPDSRPSSSAASGPGIFCWRGGRLSRHLFSWKVVPRSLVSKAARQGGCRKIPGILYPENSDFARRSKYLSWKAAVESSTSISQLALQVREFDSNIKWDDIENTDSLCKMDKELKKSLRAFKKVIIRRKVLDGNVAKYLLDFGKRRVIPEVVTRHGSVLEESSSERKRYWLNESLLPLHILKSYEEKRIARISNKVSSLKDSEAGGGKKKKKKKLMRKMTSANLLEAGLMRKKLSRERGFAYLFSRAERAEYSQCGHCKKDVFTREAVSCQFCEGLFHKRHVKKSGGAVTINCTYTCHRCLQGNVAKNITEKTGRAPQKAIFSKARVGKGKRKAKVISRRAKSQPQNYKKALAKQRLVKLRGKRATIGKKQARSTKDYPAELPLRRSARQAAKYMEVQSESHKGTEKGKQNLSKKGIPKRTKSEASYQRKRKRTQAFYSYWLNGLYLYRVADAKRLMNFRKKSIFSPGHSTATRRDKVKCRLCGEGSRTSKSSYIACEICREWYHADAFKLDPEKMQHIMGFRCHVCRGKSPPICPCQSHFPGMQNISLVELSKEEVTNGHAEDPSLPFKSNMEAEEGSPVSKKLKTSPCQDRC